MHCIVDANILIDLSRGQLLPAFFALRFPTFTSEFILQEIHADERQQLLQLGLTVEPLDESDFQRLLRSLQQSSVLSIGDWSALILAQQPEAILLIGDGPLHRIAQQSGLPVHGVLWILDQLESHRIVNPHHLHTSLMQMLEAGARLPEKESLSRLQRWRSSS